MNSGPETYLTLVEREIRILCIHNRRCSGIGILTGCESCRHVVCAGKGYAHWTIFWIQSTIRLILMSVNKRIEITGIRSPSPLEITVQVSCIIIQVKSVRIRHLFNSLYTETEVTLLRIFTTPCTRLRLTDGADIHVVILTWYQLEVVVLLTTTYVLVEGKGWSRYFLDGVRVNFLLEHCQLKLISIPTGIPGNVHFTSTLAICGNVVRHGTLRSRANNHAVQHNTSTKVVLTLKGNLVRCRILWELQLYLTPLCMSIGEGS